MFIFKYLAILVGVPALLGILNVLFALRLRLRAILWITIGLVVLVGVLSELEGLRSHPMSILEGFSAMWPLTFLPIVVIDGYILWLLLFAAAGLTISTIEYERPGWCTVIIAVTLAFLEYYTNWHPISFAIHRPYDAAWMVGAYIAAGTVWMSLRWLIRIHWDVGEKFDAIKDGIIADLLTEYRKSEEFLGKEAWTASHRPARGQIWDSRAEMPTESSESPPPPVYTPKDGRYVKADLSLTDDGKSHVYSIAAAQLGQRELPLQVSHHKAELYMWWICWPFNAVWTAIVTLGINRVFKSILAELGNLYQNWSIRRFSLD